MYERILHPTDGTQPSRSATDHALELAEQYGATLYVLYVLQAGEDLSEFDDAAAAESPDPRGRQAVYNTTEGAASRGIEAVEIFVRGSTADAILSAIDDRDIDLAVMGTHGRSGLDRLVLGSVAETVVRQAPIPVMATPPAEDVGKAAAEE